MVTFVIPTTDLKSGVETAHNAIFAFAPFYHCDAIVVLDGAGGTRFYELEKSVSVLEIQKLGGSYRARNAGAAKVKTSSEYICFLDDGVEVAITCDLKLKINEIMSGKVKFNRNPQTPCEHWYYVNAFDIEYFLSRFKFLPTICLIVPHEIFLQIGGFDEDYFSSGDVEFCNRVSRIAKLHISPFISITTELRGQKALKKKIRRQIFGQLHYHFKKYDGGIKYYFYCIARLLVNILGISGRVSKKGGDYSSRLRYWATNYHVCIWKCRVIMEGFFLREQELMERVCRSNADEVYNK